jgi:hypothetical protein
LWKGGVNMSIKTEKEIKLEKALKVERSKRLQKTKEEQQKLHADLWNKVGKILNRKFVADDIEKLCKFLEQQEQRGRYFSTAMNKTDVTEKEMKEF